MPSPGTFDFKGTFFFLAERYLFEINQRVTTRSGSHFLPPMAPVLCAAG